MDSLCNKLVKQSEGVFSLEEGVTRHLVHTTDGKVMGNGNENGCSPRRKNLQSEPIYIARQSLRFALLEQLGGHDKIQWGHQLVDKRSRGRNC
jgi:hypothetical protein